MPRSFRTVLAVLSFAVIVSGGAAAAPASQPGDANDPESCREFWEGIGVPDRKDTDADNFTPVCHLGYIAGHNNEMKNAGSTGGRAPDLQAGIRDREPQGR